MEEKDFERFEQMIGKSVKAEVGKAVQDELRSFKGDIDAKFERSEEKFDENLERLRKDVNEDLRQSRQEMRKEINEDFRQSRKEMRKEINDDFQQSRKEMREEINEDFRHHVGVLSEDFHYKLQLVAEGNQMLSEKMDRMHGELTEKIDSVAVDLAAHRADTEGHKRGYMVKEP